MVTWLKANVAILVAAVAVGAFLFQTFRIDGVPLFYTGMRTQLAECRSAQALANEAAQAAAEKAREEGRQAAAADAKRLDENEAKRQAESDATIADLKDAVRRLNQPRPPVTVHVEGGEPIVVTQAVGGMCALDPMAISDIRAALNRGR